MSGCDFTAYNSARENTNEKASTAKDKCDALEQKEAELVAAQEARDNAALEKTTAYEEWEAAEKAENAEAAKLGINPTPAGV